MSGKENNLDKVFASASAGITKRIELKKVLDEKDNYLKELNELDKVENVEDIENVLDKGIILTNKLMNFAQTHDALYILAKILSIANKYNLKDALEKSHNIILNIIKDSIRESLNWKRFSDALIYMLLGEILDNYKTLSDEEMEKLFYEVEKNIDEVDEELINLRNMVKDFLLNPTEEMLKTFEEKFGKERILFKTIYELMKGLIKG